MSTSHHSLKIHKQAYEEKISQRNGKLHTLSVNLIHLSQELRNQVNKNIEDIEDLNITINQSNLINIYNLAQTIKENIYIF